MLQWSGSSWGHEPIVSRHEERIFERDAQLACFLCVLHQVTLYALDEMGFLGDLGKAGLRQDGRVHASTAALLAACQGLGISLGAADSTWSGSAQVQGGTANLTAYCH